VTEYWLNYKMATIDLGDRPQEEAEKHVLRSKFAIVTIHDVSPAYTNRIINFANELENLKIPYNFAVIPCNVRRLQVSFYHVPMRRRI